MENQTLLILTSPPASGKTYWISSLANEFPNEKLLVISPLRALRDECFIRWGERVSVMTPEEWLVKKSYSGVVILDEFHLFFYWGDSFRPIMWEVFFELSERVELMIVLTATLNSEMQKEVLLFKTQFEEILWIDHGNQVLKNKPYSYLKAPSKTWVLDVALSEKKNNSVKLFFCQYRNEVREVEKKLVKEGFICLTCVGGESKYMAQKLQEVPNPDFIISTTVLSHGVNLPHISKIFFNYKVSNLDFWIQMVARGGRKGEAFQVIALDHPVGLAWNPFKNILLVLWQSIRIHFTIRSRHIFLN